MTLAQLWSPTKQRQDRGDKGSGRQKTMALELLLPRAEQSEGLRILDLGAAEKSHLEFFGNHGATLTIADLYRAMTPVRAALAGEEAHEVTSVFSQLLPYDSGAPFDIVLAWDILNYLTPDELSGFMRSLSRYCGPGTMLHALIATEKRIPVRPSTYRIVDTSTLDREAGGPPRRVSPLYLQQELLRLMPGFAVESRFQLRTGALEYLFSYRLSQNVSSRPGH